MQNNKHDILVDVYDSLLKEKTRVQKSLDENLFCIDSINKFLSSSDCKEVPEYDVFSPRGYENSKLNNTEYNITKLRSLELENEEYVKKINFLNMNMHGLKEILLSECKDEGSIQIETDGLLEVLNIQEEERQRIARDLHDTSLQNLAHLVHKLELTSMYIDSDPLKAKLELAASNKSLRRIIDDIRNTIFELRPMSLDDLGLKEAFERLFINLKDSNPEIDFKSEIDQMEGGSNLILMAIFRTVKECCINAIKHSGCNKLYLSVKNEAENCIIHIIDNGRGFSLEDVNDKNGKHFGLCLIREQVELLKGSIDIQSDIDSGTQICIVLPGEIVRGNER